LATQIEQHYDEFGNYIGPEEGSEEEDDDDDELEAAYAGAVGGGKYCPHPGYPWHVDLPYITEATPTLPAFPIAASAAPHFRVWSAAWGILVGWRVAPTDAAKSHLWLCCTAR